MEATRELLRRMEVHFEEPEPGCCGLAGSFGFEEDHYDIGMRIGERQLLPAVRRANKKTPILSDGFSCRTQIGEASDRRAIHPAELLDRAFDQQSTAPEALTAHDGTEAPVMHPATAALAGAALVGGIAGAAYLMRNRRQSSRR